MEGLTLMIGGELVQLAELAELEFSCIRSFLTILSSKSEETDSEVIVCLNSISIIFSTSSALRPSTGGSTSQPKDKSQYALS